VKLILNFECWILDDEEEEDEEARWLGSFKIQHPKAAPAGGGKNCKNPRRPTGLGKPPCGEIG